MRDEAVENMPADEAPRAPADAPVIMDAFLTPNRSLPNRGFLWVIGGVAAVGVVASLIFARLGAWPVVGFFGLDVLLVWLAFRASYRSGRMSERIVVTPGLLRVTRRYANGYERRWSVNTAWARVAVDPAERHDRQVQVLERGRTLILGAFLSPPERSEFAKALNAAIVRANLSSTAWAGAPSQDPGGAPAE